MIWLVVAAVAWTAVAIPVGISIGRAIRIADRPFEATPEAPPTRHLYLVS